MTERRAAAPAMAQRMELAGGAVLAADLRLPEGASGLVVFVHGSGSGRLSPRNRAVAAELVEAGLATLLLDLLTPEEETEDQRTRALRFDIPLLATRLVAALDRAEHTPALAKRRIGLFGASTGAAAALIAAARRAQAVAAVVSRGGWPDLAGDALGAVPAPTVLVTAGVTWASSGTPRHCQCLRVQTVPRSGRQATPRSGVPHSL